MAGMAEVFQTVLAVRNELEQGQALLLQTAADCTRCTQTVQAGIQGTAASQYGAILSLLEQSAGTLRQCAAILEQARVLLEQWAAARGGMPAGAAGAAATVAAVTAVTAADSPPGPVRRLSAEEAGKLWKTTLQNTDEVIGNYRQALLDRGIADTPLLDRFLQRERSRMLAYESALLDQATGQGGAPPEPYPYRVAGAEGAYGFDSLANAYGAFCLEDATGWITEINPNYRNPFFLPDRNPYRFNCGSCALAVEARLSGNGAPVASQVNVGSDRGMEAATGKRCVYLPVEQIENHLRRLGPGSHLIVGINREPSINGLPQAGHWFNVLFDGEQFHTLDGQSGEILEWPHDYVMVSEWCALL